MAKIHINFHITNPYSEKMWFLGSGWGKIFGRHRGVGRYASI